MVLLHGRAWSSSPAVRPAAWTARRGPVGWGLASGGCPGLAARSDGGRGARRRRRRRPDGWHGDVYPLRPVVATSCRDAVRTHACLPVRGRLTRRWPGRRADPLGHVSNAAWSPSSAVQGHNKHTKPDTRALRTPGCCWLRLLLSLDGQVRTTNAGSAAMGPSNGAGATRDVVFRERGNAIQGFPKALSQPVVS